MNFCCEEFSRCFAEAIVERVVLSSAGYEWAVAAQQHLTRVINYVLRDLRYCPWCGQALKSPGAY